MPPRGVEQRGIVEQRGVRRDHRPRRPRRQSTDRQVHAHERQRDVERAGFRFDANAVLGHRDLARAQPRRRTDREPGRGRDAVQAGGIDRRGRGMRHGDDRFGGIVEEEPGNRLDRRRGIRALCLDCDDRTMRHAEPEQRDHALGRCPTIAVY